MLPPRLEDGRRPDEPERERVAAADGSGSRQIEQFWMKRP
jgi:hypothetical protein